MSYPKGEKVQVWDDLDKMYSQSVELGFNGKISQEFHNKLASVKRVRQKLKFNLFFFIIFAVTCFTWALQPNIQLWQKIFALLLFSLMVVAIFKNLSIWKEISKIREQRFKEHHAKNNQ